MKRSQAIKLLILVAVSGRVFTLLSQTTDWEYTALNYGTGPFEMPALPYASDALEPYIERKIMESHYGLDMPIKQVIKGSVIRENNGVHAGYVRNLNKTIGQDIQFYKNWVVEQMKESKKGTSWWLDRMLRDLNSVPEKIRAGIRFNGGGHYNHSLFWQMMKKNGGGEPKKELAEAIEKTFGSFTAFKKKFSDAANKIDGNGWAWLTFDGKELKIETTQNEDTPLSAGREVLLGLDVWEHAYELQYKNKRVDYIAAWWNVVNWDFVAERYAKLNAKNEIIIKPNQK